jgi:3-hydroxypropanoate dehydrogenase
LSGKLPASCLDQLFRNARTHNSLTGDVPDALLYELVDLLKLGPTSANCSPARFLFVKSREAKEKLKPHLSEGNRDKTMKAPVCAPSSAMTSTSTSTCPSSFPTPTPQLVRRQAEENRGDRVRNGTLQGAYLILAARALGLNTGPMSGFDNGGVDRDFFAGTSIKSNFLCNLGYGDGEKLLPRSPRFSFDEMAKII